ncbi:MAG: response regulator transcription factor [Kineosporiaceae bacterium]|jgi:two-component system OmpR family response regulator
MGHLCIVDNDIGELQFLGRTLRDGGHEVELAESGTAALERAAARGFDLFLLELGLPDVDGLDVLRELRDRQPDVRVMVVSDRDDCATRVRCLDGGASDFVGKPFDLPELLARVRVHLRVRAQNTDRPRVAAGDATLDLVRHSLSLPDRTVALSPREFLLVKYLMSHASQVCTRDELLRAVWRYDFKADSNVVDVYVSRLRTKIPAHLIETVRHVGYSFVGT